MRQKNKDFVALILTNGRPNNVLTVNTLKDHGYTGPIHLVVDDLDPCVDEYRRNFGNEKVVVFNKKEIAALTDSGNNSGDMRSILFARNASFDIAKKLGFRYFVQLDDDYTQFRYRFDKDYRYLVKPIRNLDTVFASVLKFFVTSKADCIALSQGGDFLGGGLGNEGKKIYLKRKCMNSFICSTDRPFNFTGLMNEDVNTYVKLGSTGTIFFSFNQIGLEQLRTQSNPGGITELYQDFGTYVKSFYTVMYHPSSVQVSVMRSRHGRLHHRIQWEKTVPRIIRESLRKTNFTAKKARLQSAKVKRRKKP